jgi:hypothetical protein
MESDYKKNVGFALQGRIAKNAAGISTFKCAVLNFVTPGNEAKTYDIEM